MTCGTVSVAANCPSSRASERLGGRNQKPSHSNASSPVTNGIAALTIANLALHNRRLLNRATKTARRQGQDVEFLLTKIGSHLDNGACKTMVGMEIELDGTDMNDELDSIIVAAAANNTKDVDDCVRRTSESMNVLSVPLMSWEGILDNVLPYLLD